jgi:hypothetical protein
MMDSCRALVLLLAVLPWATKCSAFEGRVYVTITQGSETRSFLYTVGTNLVRIERTETNWPHAKNIINSNSGAVTLLFPHNRSFVRLKPASENVTSPFPGAPAMPLPLGGLPPRIGPQTSVASTPASLGTATPPISLGPPDLPDDVVPPHMMQRPTMPNMRAPQAGGFPTLAGMPALPMLPFPPMEATELKATGETTNLLGYACARYELKERDEKMEIWATDKLLPFQPWRQNQSPRLGPRLLEDHWPELLNARKLFPLIATLRFENGVERFRFEVKTITPEAITDPDGHLFQPPAGYHELDPLPW